MLSIKPNHKAVREYYASLRSLAEARAQHEGAVAPAFAALLRACASQMGWTLVEQYSIRLKKSSIRTDGALLDSFTLIRGVWEAKDSSDDLATEVRKKFAAGYPADNILFQAPQRIILWQDQRQVLDVDISQPDALIDALLLFFNYQPPQYLQWDHAVVEFRERVPELAQGVLRLIEREINEKNQRFIAALDRFMALVREAINPNISISAVEEMLIQHLLTERIFRKVFNNPDFVNRNVIAREIETVIQALTSRSFNRNDFLRELDRFYGAIETTAATIENFSHKQDFLNTVYENFFQGFSIKVADTHGIVYTPQPIVDFMVRSVEELLRREFNTSLGNPGVHVLDPFVGTGNFLLRVMHEIPLTKLRQKYADELHCNEVMLLPYYIASMNIEHLYYELTKSYAEFNGICLVDTFELAQVGAGQQLGMFVAENTERVLKQQQQDIFVIIGNPPYNARQVNENDNNKNRKYEIIDQRVAMTYSRDSQATNKNALSDPYVKAFRWAADRITRNGDEGIVAFVTNGSFIDDLSFDGMRKHLAQDFDAIYVLDLGGNVRKNSKLSGTTHNVFGIQVGVSIMFLIKKRGIRKNSNATIWYARTGEMWKKQEKFDLLNQAETISKIEWQEIKPNRGHTWLTTDLQDDFDTFLPMGNKDSKQGNNNSAIFTMYSRGLETARDSWTYNFHRSELEKNIRKTIDSYNSERIRWLTRSNRNIELDTFLINDEKLIKWSSSLKSYLQQNKPIIFDQNHIRDAIYRPFSKQYTYFDDNLNHRRGRFQYIIPNTSTIENRVICVVNEAQMPFSAQMTNVIPCLHYGGRQTQCFPYYVYDEDSSNQRENISDWALEHFRTQLSEQSISKWDIFYYVYGLLHAPQYRERYAANLRRELPRIPIVGLADFQAFAKAGRELAELHINYESQPEYPLQWLENRDEPLNWRVESMKLSKDRTSLRYNNFLSLAGIPAQAFEYKLGNRSALDWVIDQYRVSTDARSGISNDPNRHDDPEYIVRLIGKIITVSLETVKIVAELSSKSIEQGT
ncbi:type ISP restriction/modification enzyme [Herpetosiphon geysericola]|uniref:site-specific DNA-methyltransferase (adenine-specific) n=1 Tax=Herpetosiphon geysericola TaxID=70996 RepID=A0A0P6Z1S7_9CHLR|nr:type ISP restriction/modification enzyme [Herpetosiphon geysericola]KPL91056.1 DNA helicase [Herpetosiphon geysericola]